MYPKSKTFARIARQAFFFALTLLMITFIAAPSRAGTTAYVGSPSNPSALASAIQTAYTGGATTIIVNPGIYTMGSTASIPVNYWSNATISCYGCTFIVTDTNPNDYFWALFYCTGVTLEGGTITTNQMMMAEDPIYSLGSKDSNGFQTYNCSSTTGYPTLTAGTGQYCDIVDGVTRQYKPATGDFYNATVTSLGSGSFNVDFNQPCASLNVGDYIVTRANSTPYKIHLQTCTNCTVKDLVFYRNGFSTLREDQCSGTTFNHDVWAPGPPPAGSTHTPIFSCAADGSDSLEDTLGPTYINCAFLGLLNDDDIAIHGNAVPIVSASGTSVVIADNNSVVVVDMQPLRFFGATFYAQGIVQSYTDNGTDKTVTMDANYNIPSGAYVYNPDDCGAGYQILNCSIGSTRSRGIIAKADNGLIQGNTIYNAGISAVRLGQEGTYVPNEAGCAQNVSVRDNVIVGNGAMNSGYDGAFRIGSTNGEGDINISYENNVCIGVTGPMFDIQGANGVQISNNTFANTAQLTSSDNHILDVTGSNSVTLTNNIITNRGINTASPFYSINSSTNIGTTGVNTGTLSGGIYQFNHNGSTSGIDVPGNSSNSQTYLQLDSHLGTSEQSWIPWQLNNGYYNIGHLGTNDIMDVPNASKTVGADIDQYSFNTSPQDMWSISDAGNGTQVILNDNSSLALDDAGNSNSNGTAIDQNTVNGGQSEQWVTPLIAPAASTNLIQNYSFEANGFTYSPSNWYIGGTTYSVYAQAQPVAEDGSYMLVMYNGGAYTGNANQLIGNLPNGYYTASAYVQGSPSLSQAYMYAQSYASGAPQLVAYAPLTGYGSLGSWQLITIPCINVTNNQCVIGFYAVDSTGGHPLYIDNVQFVRSYSAPVSVDLTSNRNNQGIAADGATTTTGGLDAANNCYSATLLGSTQTWNGETFNIAGAGTLNDVAGDSQSITLPLGPTSYSHLYMLGAGVNGTQSNQTFKVNYTTGSPQTFTQSMSDWQGSGGSSGETTVLSMSYADNGSGGKYGDPKLFGYSFALDNTRIPSSLDLPNNANVKIVAMNLAP